jgi:hypothetical protein
MRTSSSPSPDGFGPTFYLKFWPVMGGAVMAFLNAFYQGMADFGRINQAHVVLLPTKVDVTTADGFRPVSLQNCAPKLTAKIITTRLQGVVTSLISDLQTGFVKGRSITNNFLFAFELLQCWRKRGAPPSPRSSTSEKLSILYTGAPRRHPQGAVVRLDGDHPIHRAHCGAPQWRARAVDPLPPWATLSGPAEPVPLHHRHR